jgi:serine/threonine-protein phosphatase 2A regulatory subunit A
MSYFDSELNGKTVVFTFLRFTSRVSAATLFHIAYRRLPEAEKLNFRALFLRLCGDDTPMVRRAAATNLGLLAKQMRTSEVVNEFISTFNALASDEQVCEGKRS